MPKWPLWGQAIWVLLQLRFTRMSLEFRYRSESGEGNEYIPTSIEGIPHKASGVKACISLCWWRSKNHRSEEHTSELQSRENLVCRLLLEKKKREQKIT